MYQRRAATLVELAAQYPDHKKPLTDSANIIIELSRDNSRLRSIMLAHGLMAGPMNGRKRNLLWRKCLKITSEVTGVSEADLMGRSQRHAIGNPRRIMITAWREVTNDSYTGIGRRFGKDHTAILHSVKATTAECTVYPAVKATKDRIADGLRAILDKMHNRKTE